METDCQSNADANTVGMIKDMALVELLKIIKCGCKRDCSRNCTCEQNEVRCKDVCTGCRGVSSMNCEVISIFNA